MAPGRVRLARVKRGLYFLLPEEGEDFEAKVKRAVFWPLSLAYGAVVRSIRWAYGRGLRRPKRAPIPVVSVGNVVWGGTGKTQAVIWLCRRLLERGIRVAVLHRGYGGKGAGPKVVGPSSDPVEVGDEPVLLARALPGGLVIVGRRREEGVRLAVEYGAEVAVLDDGLQYWRLRKDIEIVMWRGPLPPRGVRLIPAGPWREPLSILERAHQIWSTEGKEAAEGVDVAFEVVPKGLKRLGGGEEVSPEALKGRKVLGVCGIGRPESFARTLEELGAEGEVLAFPDHWRFSEGDFRLVSERARKIGADLIVTTEKDAVRLSQPTADRPKAPFEVYVLLVSLDILRGRGRAEKLLAEIESLSAA